MPPFLLLPSGTLEYVALVEWEQASRHHHLVIVEIRAYLYAGLIGSSCQRYEDGSRNGYALNGVVVIVIAILVFLHLQSIDIALYGHTSQSVWSWDISKVVECCLYDTFAIVHLNVVGGTGYIASNAVIQACKYLLYKPYYDSLLLFFLCSAQSSDSGHSVHFGERAEHVSRPN